MEATVNIIDRQTCECEKTGPVTGSRRVGMRPDQMVDLAEAVFTHVDQIATACVLGYAQAKAVIDTTMNRTSPRRSCSATCPWCG